MNTKTDETTFTAAEIEDTRKRVTGIIEMESLTQADVARQAGIAYGTFTGWYRGHYKGDNDKVTGQVSIWLADRETRKRTAASITRAPDFQPTRSAKEFMDALHFAQVMPEISVVAGAAGIGKTTACHEYAAAAPNVWVATMNPTTSTCGAMQHELIHVLGVVERSAAKFARAIGAKLEGTGGLLIIDEAQHLKPEALDFLRSIYDRYNIGIALVGNETVYGRLEGNGGKAQFAQLFSRIGVRVTRSKPLASDMCKLIDAWGVTDAEEKRFLKAVAAKPGALRTMTKCLQLASMLAAGEEKERSLRHLKAAWEKLSPNAIAA
ncbi:AAA family ATPase [Pyruvatibacter mobilis]|uniref:AAA family ATPase n=1 Tax=Pyruvatibacter mobilis TaxID=1712261 RepID=UPI003C7D0B18